MVWGLFPVDPLSGEDKYYIFAKGVYKVGRKGCDVIITKDKGVSRVHAEIVVNTMAMEKKPSCVSSKVQIRDCSKYGTCISKKGGLRKKVHELPNKEITIEEGDLISFGTGNATYRFCFVPLVFYICFSDPVQVDQSLQDKILSFGAYITHAVNQECTHVVMDAHMPVKKPLIDAVIAKKPCVVKSWIEFLSEKNIRTEIPCCSSYFPTLKVEGASVQVADPTAREGCLKGYTFLVESSQMYQFGNQLLSLLEMVCAKVISVEEFVQGSDTEDDNHVVCVLAEGLRFKSDRSNKLSNLYRVKEIDLIIAVLSGQLNRSVLISSCVHISSSCSTDETVVADSEDEVVVTSLYTSSIRGNKENVKCESMVDISSEAASSGTDSHVSSFREMTVKKEKNDDSERGNLDIIYSQDLVVRDMRVPSRISTTSNGAVLNFKCFGKAQTQSGNSFNNLVPFAKYPYKDSEYGSDEVAESLKEEKKRKRLEAIADDLFNNEGKRRGTTSTLRGILMRS